MDSEDQPRTKKVKRLPLGGSRQRVVFERRLQTRLSLMGLPALLLCLVLIREHEVSWPLAVIWIIGLILVWTLVVSLLLEQIVRPLQTLSNVVAGLREDDYSFRARGARRDDAMGDLALEINALAGMLQTQRAGALEAMALVERVIESMQSPMLAFDPDSRLQLLNAAAEKAFDLKPTTALGERADRLRLEHLLTTGDGDIVTLALHTAKQESQQFNRWVVKRTYFRLSGVRHTLLMLSDVSAALREEERQAWERLIRVLGHEINNSLTPIKSIASSLRGRLPESEGSGDFSRGLAIIEDRAESLNRFLQAYRRLMGLPVPRLAQVSLTELMERVVQLETRLSVSILSAPDVMVQIDADQIQQALINLVRNAVEAAMSPDASGNGHPSVEVGWKNVAGEVIIFIRDNGPGLTNESNLFVPFYTTKPGGTGVGLVLAQQIAEAHRGVVRLTNRVEEQGCVAELRLPRSSKSDG